ncbi:urea ABC transporter substrate-binding protein [Alkalihalobacillus deserti]|uniref:urea ABC transporter substrate-binding protein n=1 Tax=Alkalihalobacillus deserti TaxID=2879466 RepID=UPI001D1522E3|nr:urea ABC transporter substrate-binding protein [Alkalihalobacillus deserti]
MKKFSRSKSILMGMAMSTMVVLSACGGSETTGEAEGETGAEPTEEAIEGDEVKVGILHSLSGTMAMSETSVKDAELLAIEEINAAGGVLGKKIVPVIEDGASEPSVFSERATKLLQQDDVAVVFGGWTSASRKAMLPVFEENNGLLYYPVQYEGMEASPNIFYAGAAPNQQIVPAVEWLLENKGSEFFLLGSDYVFPRLANQIIKAQLEASDGTTVDEQYTPLGHTDYSTIISRIRESKPEVIFNTLNGDSNVAFFKQLADAGITSDDVTILSVSVAEEEIRGIGADVLEGHYASWNYYQTTDTPENASFVESYKEMLGEERVTGDPIEAAYFMVHLWAKAVEEAGSLDIDAVKAAAPGLEFDAPGGKVIFDGDNQHVWKTVRIGEVQADGQFKEVWNSGEPIKPDPFLEGYEWASEISSSMQ